MIFVFYKYVDLFSVFYPSSLRSCLFERGCLDTCAVLGLLYVYVLYFGICFC